MDDTPLIIPESNPIKVLGFKFDSLLTLEPQIIDYPTHNIVNIL